MSTKVAIVGSGNIGTDLLVKAMASRKLEVVAMAGIDPDSEGLARAASLGVMTTHAGVEGLIELVGFDEVEIVFDATSAKAHEVNALLLAQHRKRMIDLTPAAFGPLLVPAVNLSDHIEARDVNMVTCGGQATIPVVAAISRVVPVAYAEIIASIASRSAGPGTRANIDEFTETTAAAVASVGGARRGRAIIILNPAEPPRVMRDTVFALVHAPRLQVHDEIRRSIEQMVAAVAEYVPGYRLKQAVQITAISDDEPLHTLLVDGDPGTHPVTHQVSVFLEVDGAGDHLPTYAGNLDIMTAAAVRVAERLGRGAEEGAST